MYQTNDRPRYRKHLILVLIAAALALVFMLTRADPASAGLESIEFSSLLTETILQVSGDEFQSAVTTERLMILGMLGLVVLTWFYLKWRPPPGQEEERTIDPDRE